MHEQSPHTNKGPKNRNILIAGTAAAVLAASCVVYVISDPERGPKPKLPALDCTYFKMPSGTSTYIDAFVEPRQGSEFDKNLRPTELVEKIDVKIGDSGPDGPTPVQHPQLYETFGHQFVDASGIATRVDITVHAKPGSGFADGHCSDSVSFQIYEPVQPSAGF